MRLERYLDGLMENGHFKTRGEIADVCGIKDGALSMILSDPNRRLSVEQCLRLAAHLDDYAPDVLRRADREDAAELLEQLWPNQRDLVHLTRNEREHMKQWRQLTPKDKHHVGAIINICVELASANTAGRSTTANGGGRSSRRRPQLVRSR